MSLGKEVLRWQKQLDALPSEARLAVYTVALYATFMLWGYLQEKITTTHYNMAGEDREGDTLSWKYPFALNLGMSLTTYITAHAVEALSAEKTVNLSPLLFWKPALSATLGSPIGYESLKYVNYPLMVLTKSSKPVPVMLIGKVFFQRVYQWYKYLSVAFLCVGISLFTLAQSHPEKASRKLEGADGGYGMLYACYGVALILINLSMDGYTSNEQDRLYVDHPISAMQMMKHNNFWQSVYQLAFLVLGWLVSGHDGQLYGAVRMLRLCPSIRLDLVAFCLCGAVGQVLVFRLIKEYGSLVWITISVTRQLFTIVLSVLLFGHRVNLVQWGGVLLVFCGLSFEVLFNHIEKNHPEEHWDGSVPSLVRILATVYTTLTSNSSNKTPGLALQKPSLPRTDSTSSITSDIEQHGSSATPERTTGRKKMNVHTPLSDWDKRKHD